MAAERKSSHLSSKRARGMMQKAAVWLVSPQYPCKILEQILLEAISRHKKENKVVGKSQQCSSSNKSCLINLVAYYDHWSCR